MYAVLLTQYQGKILGPIAKYILGPIINLIFKFLDLILGSFDSGLIGLSIIGFTIVIYLLLMPLTVKQQKFSKLSAKMNPELQAIQAKYKDRKDQDSMMAMNAETKQVYAKYGVSPSGSCVQLLIQMPILFALYRVIYSLPAYISTLRGYFETIAQNVINSGKVEEIKALKEAAAYVKNFDIEGNQVNAVIDVLNSMNVDQLTKYAGSSANCIEALEKIKTYNFFLGMNLSNSPSYMIQQAWNNASGKQWGVIIAAILIPVLAAATQWINVKLMPQQNTNGSQGGDTAESMQQSMKMMNNVMPLMSAFFCFTFSSGIGIYWIAGSVVRSIQQVIVNKHIDKIDIDALVEKNKEKQKIKMEKKGIDPNTIDKYASMKTKSIASAANAAPAPRRSISEKAKNVNSVSKKEKDEAMNEAVSENSSEKKVFAEGSLAAKANLVRQYNENNNN
ncbi:MAG: YidC/Oxa1 family membrane protein insertase [Lachnospiraceae bacterium]|nr:YidC/Oxa1 family membrane protein insertase [Lachnospiraceae bacterium]